MFLQFNQYYIILEYLPIYVFTTIGFIISLVMLLLCFILSPRNPSRDKLTSYECGFDPFGNARMKFNIHFYLIGLLFVIFDLEVAFLFPWVYAIKYINTYEIFLYPFIFLFVLTIGFIYEWMSKSLEWSA